MDFKYDLFVSYASEDRAWSEMLADQLRARGVRVWFDRWYLKPGDHLLVRLNEALQASRRLLAIWTPNYFRDSKVWTLLESFSRQHSDPLSAERPLIPIFLTRCPVPPTLESIIAVDFTDPVGFDQALNELIAALDISGPQPVLHVDSVHGPALLIDNPYSPYASGVLVADPTMFFGREDTLDRLRRGMTQNSLGRCFVLYGQKRCGKSSILRQLERRLQPPCLPVVTSLGMLDVRFANGADPLVGLLLHSLRGAIEDHVSGATAPWDDNNELSRKPLQSFREALWATEELLLKAGWKNPRVVFLIDEFSYLFGYIKEGRVPATFMREWKALLEFHAFNAVLVGQDSMPLFMEQYPNEFGVTSTERLSYLSHDDACRLADHPLYLDGKTRYRGHALDALIRLTAGSPYYTQMFCGRLVEHLNSRNRLLITEADVEEVKAGFLFGPNQLELNHFDCLVTAAGEAEARFSREDYLTALITIARNSNAESGAPPDVLHEYSRPAEILADMRQRDIVVSNNDGTVRIKIELFAEWLRASIAGA